MLVRTPINSFNGGELSRRMEGRSDLDGIHDKALALMLNFVATVEGPAMKRPGFRLIQSADASAEWVSRFVFNSTQAYLLEWSDGKVRFYTNGARIESPPGTPYELAVPYTAAEARRLSIKQSFDRLYIAHPDHSPAMITRTGAETFTYEVIPLKNGPFKNWNTNRNVTITWSGSGEIGAVATITASEDLFVAGHVGTQFIFEVKDYSTVKAWEAQVRSDSLVEGTSLRRSDGKVYKCIDRTGAGIGNRFTGTIEPTHTEGQEWDGSGDIIAGTDDDRAGVLWEYVHDRFGVGVISEFISATEVKIIVARKLPLITQTVATFRWALGLFSDLEGWPQLVDVWAQRLIFWKGVDIAGSVTGDYFDFAPIDKSGIFAPDQGFRRRLDVSDPPVWTHADKAYLLAGSASAELVVSQINSAAGLSSDNLRGDPQSSYGSADVWPVAVGTSLLFVQRGDRKIREATFADTQDRFVAPNATIYARHITKSGIQWLAFQSEPEEMLWGGRTDGTLIAHPHSPEQQLKGFARVQLAQGTAIAGVSIPSEDGSRDELWILAELNGQKGILQLADWWDEDAETPIEDAYYVDWGVSYDGEPKAEFTEGLSHLEGLPVRVLADGAEFNTHVVTGGAITLATAASKVHIGLGYEARLKLLRPEMRGAPTMNGLRKALKRMWARVIDAGSLLVVGKRGERDRFWNRHNTAPMDAPPPLTNGDTENLGAGNGSDFDTAGELANDDALPCMIAMAVPTYELEEFKQ